MENKMKSNLRDEYLASCQRNGYSEYAISNMREMCESISSKIITSSGITKTGSGLLVGEVQSGKTSNFISLTLDVIDKELFDVIIVLGGVINDLKDQTKSRFDIFSVGKESFETLDVNSKMYDRSAEFRDSIIESELPIVIFSLKEKKNLETLNKIISNINKRVLIIDDESDQATPNNEKVVTNDFGEKVISEDSSKIHEQVQTLKNSNSETFLLLVTATPYSNLIASAKYDISPKWGYVLKSGDGYQGLDSFHQEYGDYRDNKRRIISSFKDSAGNIGRLKASLDDSSPEELSWYKKELVNSVLSFVVGNEVYKCLEEKKNFEMLIHSHYKTSDQNKIKSYVTQYLSKWEEINTNDDEIELKKQSIIREFNTYISQLPDELRERAIINNDKIINNSLDTLINWKRRIAIQINNSKNQNDKDQEEFLHRNKDLIIIGADKVQRGITFDNLRVVFMPRLAIAATADTILQRARWFGYRGKTFEYMTIFLTHRLEWLFNSYVDIKEEINGFLNKYFITGANLRNIENAIQVPSDKKFGRLTRKSVNKLGGTTETSNTVIQKLPIANQAIEVREIEILANSDVNTDFHKWKFVTKEIPIDSVNKKFLEQIFNKLDYINNLDSFISYCEANKLKTITFSLMNFDLNSKKLGVRMRSLKTEEVVADISEISISNLYSGMDSNYNAALKNHNEKYAGDRNILEVYISQNHADKNNLETLEIQVHNIQPMIKFDGIDPILFEPAYMYSLKLPNKKEVSYIKLGKVEI